MSGRPKLFINQGIPEDGKALKLYREQCEISMYDEKKGGVVSQPRDEFLRCIKGVDAIHLAYPLKIDKEALDAAGFSHFFFTKSLFIDRQRADCLFMQKIQIYMHMYCNKTLNCNETFLIRCISLIHLSTTRENSLRCTKQ
jgi:hypothetical protein